ncbi:gamma-glutamyltransferase [Galbibacter pacificus]|uniref:Glutathione hydrolase proenzyme n=1 Tax=Galbibacter pacificus TaxID=2996052 RepID=A0ABT6FQB5_9FLAO|nr:gamma-glutamyltransferase [Galbibacter pacificus]MDG3582071.1 gamma-glutamyltransferase [Galbibacter pacificus]MDG3585455.1 gamma-glutamyltransferase [Galbibacter pacificus]
MKKLLLLLSILIISCKPEKGLVAESAMVVSARAEASKIGSDIMKQGGNAFDAMIATKFALAVAYPFAGNLGGGGFMVYRLNDGRNGSLDFREKAPLAATKNMYLDSLGNVIPNKSIVGATAVGVPGSVSGLFAIHEKFGTLPMEKLIQPAINMANRGVVVTKKQANRLKHYQKLIKEVSGDTVLFAHNFKEGDTIKYTALAHILEIIKEKGEAGFYKGDIAEKIATFIQKNGGLITKEDLARYNAVWRDPVVFSYKDLKIISMGPPSSGGITLAEIMKMIAPYKVGKLGHNSVKAIQLITEAERRAYADRAYFLGDPDFVEVPEKKLLSDYYLNERMNNFSFKAATPSSEVSHGEIEIVESNQTTHFSIVDTSGNAVSVTTTLNGAYGSKLYSEELGFFFNNEMDDFSAKPGVPNMFGLLGTEANSIAPEKRMLSSMTPTIVEKNGNLLMVVGTPGGSTIITSVLQTILNVYEFNMGMQEAVNQPRFHHQWLPDEILMEPNGFEKEKIETLKALGYQINESKARIIGLVDAILVLKNGTLEGGADKRGDDTAIGF